MTVKKLLGISLALVMLIGSVPLGFSEPLRVQLEQGVETDQLQCNNPDHVLVQRTNGNVACVTERTVEKLGWVIIDESETIHQIDYEFPLSAKDLRKGGNYSPSKIPLGDFDITISNLPKVGETANVTVSFTRDFTNDVNFLDHGFGIRLDINDVFEFVEIPEGLSVVNHTTSSGPNYYLRTPLDVADGESIEISATIKAVKDGLGKVIGLAERQHSGFFIYLDETESLLKDDYYAKYPQAQSSSISSLNQEQVEPQPKEHPTEQSESTTSTQSEEEFTMTEEEMRVTLEKKGYTDDEIVVSQNQFVPYPT